MKPIKENVPNKTPFLWVIRISFVLFVIAITHNWAKVFDPYILDNDLIIYDFFAVLLGIVIVAIECQIRESYPQELFIGVIGLIIGLATSSLIIVGLPTNLPAQTAELTRVMLHLILGYFGVSIALRNAHRFDFSSTTFLRRSEDRLYGSKILDTSVLIDGRIIEIIEAGFIEGLLIIPSFVVNELQILSDSKDSMKRTRGRRGLDISNKLQRISRSEVELLEEDFHNLTDVDKKLLALSKKYEGVLLTVDFNLYKVAEIEKVQVLNINILAQSLKTIVMPGEEMLIHVVREGKEHNQGVGYLEDGTMVIIENGRRLLGKNVDVVVSSIMQTSAGRLIFTKVKENSNHHSKTA
jgi:uncharacterized protein YacL